ncbi:MAG: hypothetical protein ACP5C3_01035 [Methanomicrobiales archaeon]
MVDQKLLEQAPECFWEITWKKSFERKNQFNTSLNPSTGMGRVGKVNKT